MEDLKNYFEQSRGTGVLATADGKGNVNGALYARPHFMDDGTVAFIMNDRLTHANIQENPAAAYVFIEEGSRSEGKRLYLRKAREEENPELIQSLARRSYPAGEPGHSKKKFLVYFTVTKALPLLGAGDDGEG
ncbi:MAG TPA: pyridoxamine 5'-phosphate oxidase family protein [Spirochaetes bacterium]|nr:pyridoxamine 5'-phosphate oxidase family protein [Spirochaetota bacterium]